MIKIKKILFIAFTMFLIGVTSLRAYEVSKIDEAGPADVRFMDMAVSAAKKSMASQGPASGAVIILNGAWRSTGIPESGKTAEEVAYLKSRLSKLNQATVYTVNEPITAIVNLLNGAEVEAIYFTNPREVVVEAGIYPASAYDDSAIDSSISQAPVYQLPFEDAMLLLSK